MTFILKRVTLKCTSDITKVFCHLLERPKASVLLLTICGEMPEGCHLANMWKATAKYYPTSTVSA